MLNDLVWNAESTNVKKTVLNSLSFQWKLANSQIIFCDSHENYIDGHCVVRSDKYLQFVRGQTNKLVLPSSDLGQEFTIEMWCNFNFNSITSSYPYTEIILQKAGSILLQLTAYSNTNRVLSAYQNFGSQHIDLTISTISILDGKWVHISFGHSDIFKRALLCLIWGQTMTIEQANSTNFILTSGSASIEIGSDIDTSSLNALVRELRIWRIYRSVGLRFSEAYKELLPYKYIGSMFGYWKFSEGEGYTVRDYSESAFTSNLISTTTKMAPRWVSSLGQDLVLCGPNQNFITVYKECSNFDTQLMFTSSYESIYTLNQKYTQPMQDFTVKLWFKIVSFSGSPQQYFILQKENHFQIKFGSYSPSLAKFEAFMGCDNQLALTSTQISLNTWTYFLLTYSKGANVLVGYATNTDASGSFSLSISATGINIVAGNPNLIMRISNSQIIIQSITLLSAYTLPPYVKTALV